MKKKNKIILITVVFVAALCLILYPVISNIYNAYRAATLISDYDQIVAEAEEADYTEEWAKARAYDDWVTNGTEYDYFTGMTIDEAYESVLNVDGNGMMGYITIPCINVSLPVYHYCTDDILTRGVGHIEDTSLPIGGDSTHSVLTGHRGLPGSTLFTDLNQVELGDIFYLTILDEIIAYEVTDITVVEPEEVDSLSVVAGEDLCTLVTCTPYAINTHRLLVTGTRTDYVISADAGDDSSSIIENMSIINWLLLLLALFEIIVYILVVRNIKRRSA